MTKLTFKTQARQGDVFLKKHNQKLDLSKLKVIKKDQLNRIVFDHGESGNTHAIRDPGDDTCYYEEAATKTTPVRYYAAVGSTKDEAATHEKHVPAIGLESNTVYEVVTQNVYTPERIRSVDD